MKTEEIIFWLLVGFVGYKIVSGIRATTTTTTAFMPVNHTCPPGQYWMTDFVGANGQCAPIGTVS